jgi:hypothetical protein
MMKYNIKKKRGKRKAIPVTGYQGLKGCETSRIPHFLDNWLTGHGGVVILTCQPGLYPPSKIPVTHFC